MKRGILHILLAATAIISLCSSCALDCSVRAHGEYAYHPNRRQRQVRDSLVAVMLSIPPDPYNMHLFESSIDIGKTLFPIWSGKPNLEQDPVYPTIYTDCDRLYHGRQKLDTRLGVNINWINPNSLVIFHRLDGTVETWEFPYKRYYGIIKTEQDSIDVDIEECEECEEFDI